MSSFEQMGSAMLLAEQGRQEIARWIAHWVAAQWHRLRGDAGPVRSGRPAD
jgi:hypothetical protein